MKRINCFKPYLLVIASALFFSSNVSAKTTTIPKGISKAFYLACEKRSIQDPINDFRAVIDKNGKPRCKGYRKYAKPTCPKGYRVIKGLCRKTSTL